MLLGLQGVQRKRGKAHNADTIMIVSDTVRCFVVGMAPEEINANEEVTARAVNAASGDANRGNLIKIVS